MRPVRKNFISLGDDNDFPPLSSASNTLIPSCDGRKTFKEIFENNAISFDYDILERKEMETVSTYFNRLYDIFKRSTTLHTYDIYVIKNKTKSYKAAARHEIIARLLCQIEDNRCFRKASEDAYANFRKLTLDQMYDDDDLWDEIMGRVGGDKLKWEEAIRAHFNFIQLRQTVSLKWMDPLKTTCKKSGENCISKEKILY